MPTTEAGRALLDAPHVVDFSKSGYGLQHPIRCRPDLIGCALNQWLTDQGRPARKPGRYLMAGVGEFEPVPSDWRDPLTPDAIAAIEAEAADKTIGYCIDIVQQSLDTVRAEDPDGESRSIGTSIAAREHVIRLLVGYRAVGRLANAND